jgi:ral guanine nucleotide dissociation stimulator-like 1
MNICIQNCCISFQAISYGTIPYLGTFLTDLTMIDTAIGDVVADGLINFDKRRKEFEVLAQIKLLQGAANAYHIETLPRFTHWFDSVEVLDERECFDLSCEIEPNNSGSKSSQKAEQVFYFLSFV